MAASTASRVSNESTEFAMVIPPEVISRHTHRRLVRSCHPTTAHRSIPVRPPRCTPLAFASASASKATQPALRLPPESVLAHLTETRCR
jgi:hypothetical protein